MDSISPVWTDNEVEIEQVIALDQEEYIPIVALPIKYEGGARGVAVRFRPSDEERKVIADGGDILITELTFGRGFTPIAVRVAKPNEYPH